MSGISTNLDEILSYLDVDQVTLQRALQEGIKRLLEPQVDPKIDAWLRTDPPKTNSKLEA